MQNLRYGAPHSDLPETVTDPDVTTYKYSVPDRTPPCSTVHPLPPSLVSEEIPQLASRQQKWTRWPLLLLYGLLLAIIAGVAGGFIGRTIGSNLNNDISNAGLTDNACANGTSSPLPTTSIAASSTSPTAAPTPTTTSTVFERTLAQPTTGCASSTSYNSFKARTKFLEWQYTTICGQGWLNDELFALSAATPSDCVEACVMYNAHRSSSSDRTCVGGGFIPEWWNQTRAMAESGGMAYNCFLKSSVNGIARNDKAYEVVALCVDGSCDTVAE